jgi:outer membrane protein TolC
MNEQRTGEGLVAAFVIICSIATTGCQNFGTGGTGEMVIPRTELRDIQATDLAPVADENPSTEITATQPSTQPSAQTELTLEEARQMALQNNLELKVQLLEPTIAKTFVTEEQAQFESLFSTDVNYAKIDSPTASQLSGSQVEDLSVVPAVTIPLQTGGQISIAAPYNRFETNNQFSTLNPSHETDLALSLSIPLLRGAGTQANSQGIRVAFYDYQISEARAKLEVIRVLAAVDRVYWRLYAARKELEVRKQEYDLAVVQLERARRLVNAGVAAEPEIVRAESGVADRVEAVINAENALRDRQRELKRILNDANLPMTGPTIILPTSPPNATAYRIDADRAVELALRKRMEMLELELRIAREESNVEFARNGTLPLVTLDYTYNVNGLGPTFDDAVNFATDHDFVDHSIGVRVQVPIGNEAARSRLRRALSTRLQALATQEQRMAAITQEVLNAIDQLEANWQRILAAQQQVILNARLLDVETRQFERGLRTSTEVLNAQTSLANAQSAEINAITEYQIAQVDIAFAVGMILGSSHVTWDPIPAPPYRSR